MAEAELGRLALYYKAASPDGRGSADAAEWRAVEFRLGLELPSDYKAVVARYGVGPWADFLHVLSPFSANEYLHLERAAHRHLGALHETRRSDSGAVPYSLYPEAGGLFPWGITDNGDYLCWLTQGFPQHWPTVVVESRGPTREVLQLSLPQLLIQFLEGTVPSRLLLEPFEGKPPKDC
jgi:hypothetical protein